MFSLLTSTPVQIPSEEKKASTLLDLKRAMTFTVPGMYTVSTKSGKQKRSKSGNDPKFPSPQKSMQRNQIWDTFKTSTFAGIAASITIDNIGAFNFAFSQVSDYAELTTVFDQYRIAMVEITFLPTINVATSPGYATQFVTAVDWTDSTSITINKLRDYPSAKTTEDYSKQVRTFVPRVAVAAYSGAFTSYMSVEAPWLDTSSPNVQHYGIKYGLAVATNAGFSYEVSTRYHIQFRNSV